MNSAVLTYAFVPWAKASTASVGDEGLFVENQLAKFEDRLADSLTLGERRRAALEQFAEAVREASKPGWDGYGALPVDSRSCDLASLVLSSLPAGAPLPDTAVTPDGWVSFEWYGGARRVISVVVAPDAQLHYSVLSGTATHYGSEPNVGELSHNLRTWIDRIAI
jgi:hypothetical protein